MRTALITGATGLVGAHLLSLLSQSIVYEKIICLSRKPLNTKAEGLNPDKIVNLVIDFKKPQEQHALFTNSDLSCDDAFCCLGTTIKVAGSKEAFRQVDYDYCVDFAQLAQAHSAQHLLQVTAIGAKASSSVFYNRVKGELEKQLKQMNFQQLSIFRPSLLVGKRNEIRRGESMGIALAPLMDLVLAGPLSHYHSIKAEIVAAAMLNRAIAAADSNESGLKVLSYKKMMQLSS